MTLYLSFECFNNDEDVAEKCPRDECIFDENDGRCKDNSGPPKQCRLDGYEDICTGDEVCVDAPRYSPDGSIDCSPLTYYGFGCCKSYVTD